MRKASKDKAEGHGSTSHDREAPLASALYLAGEALASVPGTEHAHHAKPAQDSDTPLAEDFLWLQELVTRIRQSIQQNAQRAELLQQLTRELGNGEALAILFGNLFPEQREQRKSFQVGKAQKQLTPTQIEVLRATALGKTPTQIAIQRGCSDTNVTNILRTIEGRLNARSPQEAVAVAISMGYLPLNPMDFVTEAGRCATRDYSLLDSLVSQTDGIERVTDMAPFQELAAFGILLMLAAKTAIQPEVFARHIYSPTGAMYRLRRDRLDVYRSETVVPPGLLRYPDGIAVAPPSARRQGFQPGHIFVTAYRATLSGRNAQQIIELTPQGNFVRAFCGGKTVGTNLEGAHGLAFLPSGALLACTGKSLLQFTDNGATVQPVITQCCVDVCVDRGGRFYLSQHSSRGGSLGVYSAKGKQLREFARQPPGRNFASLRVNARSEVAALCDGEGPTMLRIYDVQGEPLRCWQVPNAALGSFVWEPQENRLYIPCLDPPSIAVYSLDGQRQAQIALPETVSPRSLALDRDGSLLLVCNSTEPPTLKEDSQ